MTASGVQLSECMSQFLLKPRVKGEWMPDLPGLHKLSKTEIQDDVNTIHDALVQSGMDTVSDSVRASARRRATQGGTGNNNNSSASHANAAAAGGASDALLSSNPRIGSAAQSQNKKLMNYNSSQNVDDSAGVVHASRRQRLATKIVNER